MIAVPYRVILDVRSLTLLVRYCRCARYFPLRLLLSGKGAPQSEANNSESQEDVVCSAVSGLRRS